MVESLCQRNILVFLLSKTVNFAESGCGKCQQKDGATCNSPLVYLLNLPFSIGSVSDTRTIKSEMQNCMKYIIDVTDEGLSENYISVYPLSTDYIK